MLQLHRKSYSDLLVIRWSDIENYKLKELGDLSDPLTIVETGVQI